MKSFTITVHVSRLENIEGVEFLRSGNDEFPLEMPERDWQMLGRPNIVKMTLEAAE